MAVVEVQMPTSTSKNNSEKVGPRVTVKVLLKVYHISRVSEVDFNHVKGFLNRQHNGLSNRVFRF
ncbi:hypothetical protein R6Q59_019799 [Mikania micrantha]